MSNFCKLRQAARLLFAIGILAAIRLKNILTLVYQDWQTEEALESLERLLHEQVVEFTSYEETALVAVQQVKKLNGARGFEYFLEVITPYLSLKAANALTLLVSCVFPAPLSLQSLKVIRKAKA